jgi:phage host-nuclease inhibitor protein Gam
VIAELGEKDGAMVQVKNGRFGVYINWKKVNAKLPVDYAENPEKIPLEEAWSLILEKGGKPKRAKTPQIELPPAPKRPKTAYLHFCAEKRPEVTEKVQSLGEISKELARLWAATSDRQSYEDLAAEEKAQYEEKKRVWQKECQAILDKSSTNSRMQSIKKQAPKRPKSAYLFFCADKRPQVSATSLGDVSKELARMWAKTADDHEERKKYQELAAADKKRYEQEILQFNNGKVNGIASPNKVVGSEKAAGREKPASIKATPNKTRAPSAYMLFCSENRKTIVDDNGKKLPFGETTKRLAQMWKECDEDTRRRFEDQAAREKQEMMES